MQVTREKMKKGFTIIELVVALGLLVMLIFFANAIFKVSVDSYRIAGANTEVMQKLRAITDQLNRDFKGLQKDGYLLLYCKAYKRMEYQDSTPRNFRADRLYYFSKGDFQSWFDPAVRSNIGRVYFGHDSRFLNNIFAVSDWSLARDVELITPGRFGTDCNSLSYAHFKADVTRTTKSANILLGSGIPIDILSPGDIRGLMCQNVGEIIIEWTNGTTSAGQLQWWGLSNPIIDPVATAIHQQKSDLTYKAQWDPHNRVYWPKALKFIFRLYDSKGILEGGRMFTHIVYIGD